MAMSLEDLLAEEGFKRRKDKMKARASFALERRSGPLYMEQERHVSGSLLAVRRTERTRSDIPRSDFKAEFSTSGSFSVRKPRDNLSRDRGIVMNDGRRSHGDLLDAKRFSTSTEITEVIRSDGIVEEGTDRSYKDIYSNKVYGHIKHEGNDSAPLNGIVMENKKDKNNSFKHTYPHADHRSYRDTNPRSVRRPQSSERRSSNKVVEISGNKFDESRSIRQNKLDEVQAAPALDEAAVKAIISIFSGHAKRFLDDEDFRTSLHHSTFASLNLIGVDESLSTESKVVENLQEAIETIEKAAEEESANLKELKRASLQLSVIAGLNSSDIKDGFTSGVPNLRLSACAHLYLSVIYMLQRKDKVAAKHLVQVFCDSPFQARTLLLPDLWDHVFLPHLLHLKEWYDKETYAVPDSPVLMNPKLRDKAYSESLDSGTYQFAMYYKDWMIDGAGEPAVPVIRVPSFSVQLMLRGGLLGHTSSPASHVSPQPMVSKELYNEVFKHSDKPRVESDFNEEENFDSTAARNSNSPAPEDKQLILCTNDSVIQANKEAESPTNNIPEVAWIMHSEDSSGEENRQGNLHVSYKIQALPPAKDNNLVIEMEQTEDSDHHSTPRFLPHPEDASDHVVSENKLEPSIRELQENYEYFTGKPVRCSIPKDFVCPLTGLLFKNPVTLETGETFEHEAIADWFSTKGCFTCPVTGKTLQYEAVPPTNLILKRIIDKWKTDHIEPLLALLSQVTSGSDGVIEVDYNTVICILGELLQVMSKEERIIHTRRVISLGGLQLLSIRFDTSNAEEKMFILALLCSCIDADADCRNWIARNINKSNLLEVLQSEELESRKNAVLLLAKLVCFNRRSRAKFFLEGLGDEELLNAMDHLNMYLQTCPLEQTPLVAILILHLDLLSGIHTSNIYRQKAVDALSTALIRSLTDDEKIQKKCCRALLILGGFFSSSGKLMTEDWILKLAGFLNGPDWDVADDRTTVDGVTMVDSVSEDDEEEAAREKWLKSLSASLLGDGKKSFLEAVSKCLSLGKSGLVRVCLTTVAWLSFSLASLHDTKYQLSAFSALISPLKQYLEYGVLVEQRILASLSLLNFSTIPECRMLLMKIADEIGPCLDDLAEVTWTATELYAIIYGQRR
ncbi:putative E3 ubiquitin-protein ligase LIN-1 [Salvia miltiorrhiza]|uniref:putative E3 ubiquitin-protein ligase LIN-1 n=1 Tax=Salvia miltiorrhiza TaxID=226208 RepID=UPI0025AD1B77|nr:putative E3 ubiquitin-protein ligase LIN-1 [Salvia miltiorrhiza]